MAFNNIPPNGFPQIPDVEDLEAVVKDVATLKAVKAAKTDIAPEFSATGNYAVGDLVYHEGSLYACTTAHAAAAWNAEHFIATSVATELGGVVGDISDLNDTKANQITIAPFFSAETAYEVGDLVYYNGLSYRCTNDHEGAWDADDFAATTIAGELDTLKSGLTNVGRIPTTSPEIAITSIAGGANYTYTATSDGFLAVHAPLSPDAREFNVYMRDNGALRYGVAIYAKIVAYHGDTLGGLFVKAGRTYYIDNVGSNSVELYLST